MQRLFWFWVSFLVEVYCFLIFYAKGTRPGHKKWGKNYWLVSNGKPLGNAFPSMNDFLHEKSPATEPVAITDIMYAEDVRPGRHGEYDTVHAYDSTLESSPNGFRPKHWYSVYATVIQSDIKSYVPPSWFYDVIRPVIYGLRYAAFGYTMWNFANVPDGSDLTLWGQYDTILLLFNIDSLLGGLWTRLFFSSAGYLWWLRIAFMDMLGMFVIASTILAYLDLIGSVLGFWFFFIYALWLFVLLYLNGIFLRAGYLLRYKHVQRHAEM